MSGPLLSSRSRVFEGDDPYAVSGYVNQHVGSHGIQLAASARPEARLDHQKFASLDLCQISYGASVRVTSPALEDIFHLQILQKGHCLWKGRDQEGVLVPGELLLINPDDPVDLTYSEDCEKFILKLPVSLLEATCNEQRWLQPSGGVRFTQSRYRLQELEGFMGLLSLVCQEAESGLSLPRISEHYSQIVASKLLTLLHTNVSREALCSQSASFERIADYIERNLKLDINVEQLASQAHISLRSLYALFERHAGCSPNNYVRRKKLERIHACLSDSACGVRNVTEIALDYGFLHLGRFSQSYRLAFGELPSETFKRRG